MDNEYRVSKNILYNFLGQIVLLILGVFTTPFILTKLGKDSYGILILITSVVGYFSILDLGLGTAIIKNISDSLANKDKQTLKKIISTAFFFFLIIGSLGALLLILSTKIIINKLLHIPSGLLPLAELAFYLSSFSFFISMISVVLISIPAALQRMDIVNSRNIILGILQTLGSMILLMLGLNLLAVVIWNVLISVTALIVFALVIRKILPGVLFSLEFDKKILFQLLRFGGFKFISNISGQITFQLDRFLIGAFQPIAVLAFYNPPLSLVQKGFSSLLNITSATFPAISQSNAEGDMGRIKKLYLRMSRLIAFVTFPILAIFFMGADQLLHLWLGEEFARQGGPVLKVFALAYLFIAASAAPVVVAEGMNKPKIPAMFGVLGSLINLISALILIPKIGIIGAALALLINCILQVPFFVWFVSSKIIKISVSHLLSQSYIKVGVATIFASILAIYFFISTYSVLNLVLGLFVFSISYLLFNIFLRTFDEQDKLAVRYIFKKVAKLS